MSAPSLSGKTAIVTGPSSGIGRAIAERLGGAGACVYLAGRSQGPMDELAKRIAEAGGTAHAALPPPGRLPGGADGWGVTGRKKRR